MRSGGPQIRDRITADGELNRGGAETGKRLKLGGCAGDGRCWAVAGDTAANSRESQTGHTGWTGFRAERQVCESMAAFVSCGWFVVHEILEPGQGMGNHEILEMHETWVAAGRAGNPQPAAVTGHQRVRVCHTRRAWSEALSLVWIVKEQEMGNRFLPNFTATGNLGG
jgi:hypothetical protein